MGRVLSDIQRLYGTFDVPQTIENKVVIIGRAPVAAFMSYGLELVAFTKGKGSMTLVFDGYDLCHNEEEVIERMGYNKEADIQYAG